MLGRESFLSGAYSDLFHLEMAPDLLVAADAFKPYSCQATAREGTRQPITLNPGIFSMAPFHFMVYYPFDGRSELSALL